MTLFEGEQNGKYETDHLHMVLNEHIDFTEEGLSDDRKYSIFVHEYVHYYQHFATLYGSQFCKMANLLFIETRAFLEGADKVVGFSQNPVLFAQKSVGFGRKAPPFIKVP